MPSASVGAVGVRLCIITSAMAASCTAKNFRMYSLFGRGADWPIECEALRPYYDAVQAEVGLSGHHAREGGILVNANCALY